MIGFGGDHLPVAAVRIAQGQHRCGGIEQIVAVFIDPHQHQPAGTVGVDPVIITNAHGRFLRQQGLQCRLADKTAPVGIRSGMPAVIFREQIDRRQRDGMVFQSG